MTEPDLAERLATDLDGTFEALVVALQGPVFRFGYRYCGNPQDAEEIAQDAFVRAYRAMQGYEAERIAALRLTPWLLTITVNVARNRVRRKHLSTVDLDGVDELLSTELEEPGRVSERRELGDRLAAALQQLPPRYRAPVILRHVLGLSYEEISETLDQPPGTAKSNVHRGVHLLREQLADLDRTASSAPLSALAR